LDISDHDNLTSLANLSNLTTVGEWVDIAMNDKLTSLTDLKNLASICSYLSISSNKNLIDLSLETMDAKRVGRRALSDKHFTDDQKWFLMRDVFGFSSQDIAQMAGMSLSRVNVRIKRVRDKYKEMFEAA